MKTKSLIQKLQLKPKTNESSYSQTFINRERDVVKKLRTYTKHKVTTAASLYHEKRERMRKFEEVVLDVKLGLKKKLSEEEKMYVMSKMVVAKRDA